MLAGERSAFAETGHVGAQVVDPDNFGAASVLAVALEKQDLDSAEQAFNKAVGADPGFWDARQAQLLALSRQLAQSRQSPAACLNRTRIMIENLGAMPVLAQNRMQFRDIADRFGARSGGSNPAFHLLAGLGYLWAGDHDKSRSELTAARRSQGKLPSRCEALIIAEIDKLLARPRPRDN